LRRLARESVGTDGDAAPLIRKNLPPHYRRRRQKISGMSDANLDAAPAGSFKKRAGHVARAGAITNDV